MKLLLSIFFLLFVFGLSFSQNNSFYNRSSIAGKVYLTKKLSISAELQGRWNLTERSYSKSLVTLESKFALTESIKIGLLYRNSWQTNEYALLDGKRQMTSQRISFGIQIEPSKWLEIDKYLGIQFTSKIQYENFKFKREQLYWRNKLTLRPQIKSKIIKPFLSAESFYRSNQYYFLLGDQFVTEVLMNEMRYSIGTDLEINKSNTFTIVLLLRDYQTAKNTNLILSLSYEHTFRKNKKK
jgi:hypothetical protein